MPPIKSVYEKQDDIPEQYVDLFEERDGKFCLVNIEGLATEANVTRLTRSLEQERTAHRETKNKLKAWGDLDREPDEVRTILTAVEPLGDKPEDVVAKIERIPELEQAAEGKLDGSKVDELVEQRLRNKLAPIEREKNKLTEQLQEREGQIQQFQTAERRRKITDAVRSAATQAKVRDTAIDDVLLHAERVLDIDEEGQIITKDGVGLTPGVGPDVYIQEMQSKRPHWWPESTGSGARGSGTGGNGVSKNPFSAEHWNMTEQGRIFREDAAKAEQLAKSAGTTIGGPKPQPKR